MVRNKKAAEKKVIVWMIITIISLAIAGFFLIKYFAPFFLETIDKETCHNSAVLRVAIIEKGGVLRIGEWLKILPPLKCKTQYSCLSIGEKCPEEKYEKIIIRDEKEIKKEIANVMYDCWWMLGEGTKIFPRALFKGVFKEASFCVICSVITFSEDVQKKHGEIKNMDFYLADRLVPEKKITYSEYISLGDIGEIDTTEKQMIVFKQTVEPKGLEEIAESSISVVPYSAEEIEKLKCQVEGMP